MILKRIDYASEANQIYKYVYWIEPIGHICFKIDFLKKNIYIRSLEVFEKGKGFGSMLLNECINDAIKYGIKIIYLDDFSERQREENNIYIKFGFNYFNDKDTKMFLNLPKLN